MNTFILFVLFIFVLSLVVTVLFFMLKRKMNIPEKEERKSTEKKIKEKNSKKKQTMPLTESLTTLLGDDIEQDTGFTTEYATSILSENDIAETEAKARSIILESGSLSGTGEIITSEIAGTGILSEEYRTELLEEFESGKFKKPEIEQGTTLLGDFFDEFLEEAPVASTEVPFVTDEQMPLIKHNQTVPKVEEGTEFLEDEEKIDSGVFSENMPEAKKDLTGMVIGETLANFTYEGSAPIFIKCIIKKASFSEKNLAGAKFHSCIIEDSSFLDTNLTGAIIEDTSIKKSNFKFADLSNAKLLNCRVAGCSIEKTEFENAIIDSCTFDSCTADKKTNFEKTVIKASKFTGENIPSFDAAFLVE